MRFSIFFLCVCAQNRNGMIFDFVYNYIGVFTSVRKHCILIHCSMNSAQKKKKQIEDYHRDSVPKVIYFIIYINEMQMSQRSDI